jgi:glutamate N-acetyltransferase/amino-acid N-acetyltransferase
MIRPDMATMLGFVATDAAVPSGVLQACLQNATERSFNRITVDGDTSTNDACVLLASGKSPVRIDDLTSAGGRLFQQAVNEVCLELAQKIVRDAEGATKFMTIDVRGAETEADAREVAYTVAHSPLVKTAFFASDPNWGRILAAVGRANIARLDVRRVSIHLNGVCVVRHGGLDPEYHEAKGAAVMRETEIVVLIDLGAGPATAQVWTCDFSHDYVRINAEYRT